MFWFIQIYASSDAFYTEYRNSIILKETVTIHLRVAINKRAGANVKLRLY